MEVRIRSQVSRTTRGYSVEATLDIGETFTAVDKALVQEDERHEALIGGFVDVLSEFQIRKLKEHMEKLGTAFPREDT